MGVICFSILRDELFRIETIILWFPCKVILPDTGIYTLRIKYKVDATYHT